MKDIRIQQLIIDDDGLQIGFLDPEDMKKQGIAQAHTLLVSMGADYDDEIQSVVDALVHLVNDVLDDWDKLETEAPATVLTPPPSPE